jgi:hypothetical protein
MDIIQKALVVIGTLALLEAVCGLASPRSIKQMVGWFVKVSGPTNGFLGVLFLLVTVVLIVFVLAGQPLSAWVLLAVALLFAWIAALCFKSGSLPKLLSIWFLNRGLGFIRTIYVVELVVALAIIGVALAD